LRTREPAIGDTHVAADIGCSTFSTQAPFNVGTPFSATAWGSRRRARWRRCSASGRSR
jgi:hypothetical protein